MIARAARLTGMNTALGAVEVEDILAEFSDSHAVATWARSELAFLFHAGILDDASAHILPQSAILRGEIAEMLYRLLDRANLL